MEVLWTIKSLSDLSRYQQEHIERNKFKILIIDDEDIAYEDELKSHNYHHTHVNDIDTINYVAEYHIVICDIKGVGKKFKSAYEGAHIINEIDKLYPHKIKIAYTGSEFDIRYNRFFELCDATIHKDDDFESWIEHLDKSIKKVSDPIDQWKRVRDRLIKADVPLYDIFTIEQDYIKTILNNNERILRNSKGMKSLQPDLKQIILGLITNGIFTILTSGVR